MPFLYHNIYHTRSMESFLQECLWEMIFLFLLYFQRFRLVFVKLTYLHVSVKASIYGGNSQQGIFTL
ncbi:CLUMA_CG016917, isoform A [Clunio marinus]|uniref:CLUMA_CG016917, isoform A n=1 Tax=Clunio marinus TaxID=568069 RepID=A0A1J1IV93_9DIPT|nr:CLUMA_CG016917, isoform A [Clunio marinus]